MRHILLLITLIIFSLTTATGKTDKKRVENLIKEKKFDQAIKLVDNSKNIKDSKKDNLHEDIIKGLIKEKKFDDASKLIVSSKYIEDSKKGKLKDYIESLK